MAIIKPVVNRNAKPTNREILELYVKLTELKHVPSFEVNKLVSKTIISIKPLFKAYTQEKLIPKSELYTEYEKTLDETYKTLATPEGGEPKSKTVQQNGQEYHIWDIDFNSPEVVIARASIEKQYADAIKERNEQFKSYAEWLEEECSDIYELQTITYSMMPKGDSDYKELFDALSLMLSDKKSVEEILEIADKKKKKSD